MKEIINPKMALIIGQLCVIVGFVIFAADSLLRISIPYFREVGIVLFGAGAVLSSLSRIGREIEQEKNIQKKESEVRRIGEGGGDDSTREFLQRHLRLAIAREELTVLRAGKRADALFTMGFFLLIVSVACPLAASAMYWWLEPLAPATVRNLSEIKKVLGEMPKDIGVSAARDWRILLGGITFGFLCLAAARGLLNQQAKEMETFFRVGEKVNYFERLSSSVDIKLRHVEKPNEMGADLVGFMVDGLRGANQDWAASKDKDAREAPDSADDASSLVKVVAQAVQGTKI